MSEPQELLHAQALATLDVDKSHFHEGSIQQQILVLSRKSKWGVASVAALSFSMHLFEQTIVATALPSIARDLHGGHAVVFVIDAYIIGMALPVAFVARLSEVFGRKKAILTATAAFFVTTGACALSRSLVQLIIFRGFQGICTASLSVFAMLYMSDCLPLAERGPYQALIEGCCMLAQGIGPYLGGALASCSLGWRSCFWATLPLIALLVVAQLALLPRTEQREVSWRHFRALDYIGTLLSGSGAILLATGVLCGKVYAPWSSPLIISCCCLGLCSFIAFGLWEYAVARIPLLPPASFRTIPLATCQLVTFLSFGGLSILMVHIPGFLQIVRGFTPEKSGALYLLFGALLTFVIYLAVVAGMKIGMAPIILLGLCVWTAFAGLLYLWTEECDVALVCSLLVMGAIGAGGCDVTVVMYMQQSVDEEAMAMVTSSRHYMRQLGSALCLAAATSMINNSLIDSLENRKIDAVIISTILDDPSRVRREYFTSIISGTTVAGHSIITDLLIAYRRAWYFLVALLGGSAISSACLLFYTPERQQVKALSACRRVDMGNEEVQ